MLSSSAPVLQSPLSLDLATASSKSLSTSNDSLNQQFVDALRRLLEGAGLDASQIQVASGSQNSGGQSAARQILITIVPPSTTTAPASTAGSTTPASSGTSAPSVTPILSPALSSADRYWQMQPPEVQKLRDIQDPQDREAAAYSLAQQGYSIDWVIMVAGYDPQLVMTTRQNEGYTWTPSLLQQNIPVCPGLSMPGAPSYDPFHPPAGSIKVTTDFV